MEWFVGTLVGRHDHESGLWERAGKSRLSAAARQSFPPADRGLPRNRRRPSPTRATSTNIYQSPFAIVPELDLNLAFAITPHLTARIGYTFIYWSSVLRPGDQINSTVSPQLIPSEFPRTGTSGPNQPQYQDQHDELLGTGAQRGARFPLLSGVGEPGTAVRGGFLFLAGRGVI